MDSLNSLDELLDFDEDKGAKPSGVPPSGVLCPADPSRPLPKTEACEEEELEWLSNKDAFPAVEMAALVGSIGLLTGGIGNAKHQSPVSVLESNTTTITPTLMSSCGIPKPPHRARSKGRSKRGNSSFAGILGQRLLWNHASANVNDEGEKGKTTKEKRKCQHCGASETPLWRQGPLGPKTLCNACGMRHRSGRLVPEYRPLHSPTFSKNLHSNIHKKVVEMRKKESGTEMVVKPVDKGFPGIPEEKDLRQAHKYRRVKVTKAETMRTSITPKNEEGLCFPGIPEKELLNQTHKYSIVEGTEVETRRITIARKNEEGLSISGIPEEERLNQSNKYRKVEGTKAETMRTSITRKNDEGLCFPRIPDKELLNRTHKYNKVEGTEAETRRMTIARKNKEGLAFSGIPEDERLNQSNKYSKVEGTKAGTMRLVITRKNEEEGLAAPYVHPPFVEGTPIKKSCQSCGAKNTLQWRQGSLGKKTLCYACWRRCKSEIIKKKCQRCGTEKTPKWWALGEEHLCNSCGVKHNSKLIKRKCLHCGTEETSRWWALGADTLCNVCGVEHNSETFERKCQQCGTEHSHHWCIIGAKTLCSDCGVKYKSEIIGRNCQHCRTEKTLQWWAGPFGSKTLCDGCGVMYSSGSLDPENSPSDTQHSQASRIQIGTRL